MLAGLERDSAPFGKGKLPSPRGVHWVTPRLVGQVGFSEWTDDGELRHPRFQGLRDDKEARATSYGKCPVSRSAAVTDVPGEPVGRQRRDLVNRAGLGKQVARARDDRQGAAVRQVAEYRLVEREHLRVRAADDEQGGGAQVREQRTRQVGRPPLDTTARTRRGRLPAVTRAAAAPVLAPNRP